jgi:phosphonoacetate hydrolase
MDARSVTVNGRLYRWPRRPVVVVCLDGSAFEYIERAIAAGAAPYLQSLVGVGFWLVESARCSRTPTTSRLSMGVPPSVHGIGGNFFLIVQLATP